MILLSLLLHRDCVYLMRDIPKKQSKRKKSTLFNAAFNVIDFGQFVKYLMADLSQKNLKFAHFEYDIDRVTDDFVFLSFFVGNDFIPCLPFMNMRDGAFEYLLSKYVETAPFLPSYLVNGCNVKFDSLIIFLSALKKEQSEILKSRANAFLQRVGVVDEQKCNRLSIDALNKKSLSDLDFIKFGESGYEKRYYQRKFCADYDVNDITFEYVRALSWTQHYYYNAVISWDWSYKHHFAPLLSDLARIDASKVCTDSLWQNYKMGAPLPPLTQLALVMPPKSAKITLPTSYFNAIYGKESKVKKFYPDLFEIDLNFKELYWESTAIINHCNVDFLQSILDKCPLSKEWRKQNEFHSDLLFVCAHNKMRKDDFNVLFDGKSDTDTDNANINVCKYQIKIPKAANLSCAHKKCQRSKESAAKLKKVNEKKLKIASDAVCKFFAAGLRLPHGQIGKYLEKRPKFKKMTLCQLRRKKKKQQKKIKNAEVKTEKIKIKMQTKERSANNEFLSKLKMIGVRQKMNKKNNASKLIIDSVLSAMMSSKNEQKKDNKKQIKMKVKKSKKFEKKKNAQNEKNGSNKKRRRKMKREKLQKMLKSGGSDIVSMKVQKSSKIVKNLRMDKGKKYGQYPILSGNGVKSQQNERNKQMKEVEAMLN